MSLGSRPTGRGLPSLGGRIAAGLGALVHYDVFPQFSARVRRLLYNPLGVLLPLVVVALAERLSGGSYREEGLSRIYRALSGPDPRDPQTLAWPPVDPLPALHRGVAGLRLAVLPDVERTGVEKEVLAAYDTAVSTLAGLGAQIIRVEFPRRLADYAAATGTIIGAEGYRFVGHLVDDPTLPTDPHVRPRIQLGKTISARDYLLALAQRQEHVREFATALGGVDAILTPTARTAAIPIDRADQSGTAAHFTRPGNYLGLCGLAVPSGFSTDGMPLSLQILCHAGEEATALRIGWVYEQATSWKTRRPPEP